MGIVRASGQPQVVGSSPAPLSLMPDEYPHVKARLSPLVQDRHGETVPSSRFRAASWPPGMAR